MKGSKFYTVYVDGLHSFAGIAKKMNVSDEFQLIVCTVLFFIYFSDVYKQKFDLSRVH